MSHLFSENDCTNDMCKIIFQIMSRKLGDRDKHTYIIFFPCLFSLK